MGGAVALLLHKKDPSFWNGAVLVAPMCKVLVRLYINTSSDPSFILVHHLIKNQNILSIFQLF